SEVSNTSYRPRSPPPGSDGPRGPPIDPWCGPATRRGRLGFSPDRRLHPITPEAHFRSLSVNTRIVLLGTEQDFFLNVLEMLVPGGAREHALEIEEQGSHVPSPDAAPFEVWFAYCGTDGLDEIRRLRRVGAQPAVAMVDMADDPEDALEIAGRL